LQTPIAVSEPFPLFTPAAVKAFREDILSTKILDDYVVSSHLAARQAREFNPKVSYACLLLRMIDRGNHQVSPFTHAAWSSPEVTRCGSLGPLSEEMDA
jgi:hypothetical protein